MQKEWKCMIEETKQTEMIEHCLREIRKFPYHKIGLEHYVFMKLLENLSAEEYVRLVEEYKFIIKE